MDRTPVTFSPIGSAADNRGDTASLLAAMPLFAGLTEAELEQLAAVAVPRKFSKHEIIFYEGSPGDSAYVVRSGRVLINRASNVGKTITLAEMGPGAFFGELSMFDGEVRSATAECLEDSQLIAMTSADVRYVLRQNPDLALKVIVGLTRRMRDATDRISSQFFSQSAARIAAVVLQLEDAQNPAAGIPGSVVRSTQAEIAQLASTTRETVSRFLAERERDGVLTTKRGKLTIHDRVALQRFVQ